MAEQASKWTDPLYYNFIGIRLGHLPPPANLPPELSLLEENTNTREGNLSQLLSSLESPSGPAVLASLAKRASEEVPVGYGLPAIPKRLHDKMLTWEYIDLAELPPARAMPKEPALAATGNIWLVQSTDLAKSQKRLIPEITTWVQCFAIYTSVVATKFADRVPSMQGYMVDIIRASRQFK